MPNIHGLSSIKNNQNEGGEDNSSDSNDENRQGFYVGGSDHSGQEVLGPPGANNDDLASRLFDAARQAGAEQISSEELESSSRAEAGGSIFRGGAYRLGGHGLPSEPIFRPTQSNDGEQEAPLRTPVAVNFNVWQDGFSIDDGPLRSFSDLANRPFLETISHGRIPPELIQQHPGRKIDFHMIRKNSPYVPPKLKPFSGEGQRLGSVVPNVVGSTSSAPPPELVELDKPSDEELKELLKKAQEAVNIRAGEPTTRVQIRLPMGGPPMVATFNQNHTITDLRTFIVNAQPTIAFQPFQLVTAYPVKVIEDEKETLKEAGLLNAAVNVKYV